MVKTILHVVPDRDVIDHEPARDCVCGPTTDVVYGYDDGEEQWIITHHALDTTTGPRRTAP